ncbi:hypothetical protein Y1Q_0015850 [Alligator mississippiensis]|uniref:Uncharacterized protein n=1 Tax=Alligator mississippiensis TaxID=8496 RepID=A0A151MH69_ALLMI|nr:hypothetical protein Y1Q_0015850 [Alligator mississippiensis]
MNLLIWNPATIILRPSTRGALIYRLHIAGVVNWRAPRYHVYAHSHMHAYGRECSQATWRAAPCRAMTNLQTTVVQQQQQG